MFIAPRKSPRSSQTPSATFSIPCAQPTPPPSGWTKRLSSRVRRVPWIWKAGMVVLVVCLVASMAIAIVRLATTPTEILGDGFRGLPADRS